MKKMLLFILIFSVSTGILYSAERTVLKESFTSTTCPPCVPANQYFDNWYNGHSNAHRVAVIKYHVWWPAPGNDPFYAANPTEVQTRNTYYSNNIAPRAFINGTIDGGSSYSTWPTHIINQLSVASPFIITISGNLLSGSGTVNIKVKSDGTTIPPGTLVLHTTVVESGLEYTGSNGDPIHNHVMRKMYPNASGETFTISLNDSITFTRNITWNPSWTTRNSQFIAFVQIQGTKSILQAAKKNIDDIVLNVADNGIIPSSYALYQNTPNPFNPSTKISFSVPSHSHVKLSVFDILGREINVLVSKQNNQDFMKWISMQPICSQEFISIN